MIETLLLKLESIGWRAALVPYSRRAEAIREVVSRHEQGELNEAFYQEYLAPRVTEPDPGISNPRSLIVVAVPDRPVRIHLTLDGAPFAALASPGYLRRPHQRLLSVVREILEPAGFTVARVDGPAKTIATMIGLARFGRSNLSYISGLGSFYHLALLASDLACDDARPRAPELLPRCQGCRACLAACPTGAIARDRFLLHAERCLSFWNEKPARVPFPAWIKPEWHNAIGGCLLCQQACPENHPFLDEIVEGPAFDEETTRLFLAGTKKEDFSEDLQTVLEEWWLTTLLDVLPRNLGVLAEKERTARASAKAATPGNGTRAAPFTAQSLSFP